MTAKENGVGSRLWGWIATKRAQRRDRKEARPFKTPRRVPANLKPDPGYVIKEGGSPPRRTRD